MYKSHLINWQRKKQGVIIVVYAYRRDKEQYIETGMRDERQQNKHHYSSVTREKNLVGSRLILG